jgi:TPR repeat protein
MAQHNLGFAYGVGQGLPQDYGQAAFWYRKAADQGNAEAQLGLGLLYAQGQGVPQDYVEAYFWFDLAAAGKLDTANAEAATKNRDRAASYLTPTDLSGAQERARKWFEDHPAKPQ